MRGPAFVVFHDISSATNALCSIQIFSFYDNSMVSIYHNYIYMNICIIIIIDQNPFTKYIII